MISSGPVEDRLAIRELVESTTIGFQEEQIAITSSVGVATYARPEDYDTPENLIEAADHALYAAKKGGRNRVEVAPQNDADS